MHFSIIIPAYNEEQSIASIIERSLEARSKIIEKTPVSEVEVIVVNDGSSDQTCTIASNYKQIELISYEHNKGYGAAIKLGFAKANSELVGFLDADGTCDPDFFVDLINNLLDQNADVSIGSRLGADSEMPKIRHLGNRLYVTLVNFLGNVNITDCASGMRVIKKTALSDLYPLPDGLHFTPAMSCKALMDHKLKIVELPMKYKEREGRSKLSVVKDGLRFLKSILSITLFFKPLKFMLLMGLFFILLGISYSIEPIVYYFLHQRFEHTYIYRMISILVSFLVGFSFILFGIFIQRFLNVLENHNNIAPQFSSSLLRFLSNPTKLFLSGILISLLGILLNSQAIYFYLTTGRVHIHWLVILSGALLVLTGMEIVICALLNKILDMFREQRDLSH